MSKRLHVSIAIKLPDDPFAAASIYTQLQPSWASLIDALKASGGEYDVKFQEREARAGGKRGSRKPRLVPAPDAAA
jgi:hypothetical protein